MSGWSVACLWAAGDFQFAVPYCLDFLSLELLWGRPAAKMLPHRRKGFFPHREVDFWGWFVFFLAVGIPICNRPLKTLVFRTFRSRNVVAYLSWCTRECFLRSCNFPVFESVLYREASSHSFLWENRLRVQLQDAAWRAGNNILMRCINSPQHFSSERSHSERCMKLLNAFKI